MLGADQSGSLETVPSGMLVANQGEGNEGDPTEVQNPADEQNMNRSEMSETIGPAEVTERIGSALPSMMHPGARDAEHNAMSQLDSNAQGAVGESESDEVKGHQASMSSTLHRKTGTTSVKESQESSVTTGSFDIDVWEDAEPLWDEEDGGDVAASMVTTDPSYEIRGSLLFPSQQQHRVNEASPDQVIGNSASMTAEPAGKFNID